ncbi:MAG: RNA polymerase sigma factor [Deltaproteobacteria bacterium]|nr:RNA polymerase sigma factor [Deltaproteobacteria bacterium]
MDAHALDDAELCRLAARGDDPAFNELCRRHTPALLRMCATLGLPDADASDIVQEALCRVLEKRHFLASVTRVRGWLYRVALNLARTRGRKASRQAALLAQRPHDVPVGQPADPAAERDYSRLSAALETLSPRQRDVVVLRASGLSFAEVARTLSTSENACKVHMHHAVTRLKTHLGGG